MAILWYDISYKSITTHNIFTNWLFTGIRCELFISDMKFYPSPWL